MNGLCVLSCEFCWDTCVCLVLRLRVNVLCFSVVLEFLY